MDPFIAGFADTEARIGSRDLIFLNYGKDDIVVTYENDFSYYKDENIINYDRHDSKDIPWYLNDNDENSSTSDANYNISYYYHEKKETTIIELKNSEGKVIDSLNNNAEEIFQLGDAGTSKYILSNGDILFVNAGDGPSSVLFTINNPIIKFYKSEYSKKKNSDRCKFEISGECQFNYTEIHTNKCYEIWQNKFYKCSCLSQTDIISNDQIAYTLHKLYEHQYMKRRKLKLTKKTRKLLM